MSDAANTKPQLLLKNVTMRYGGHIAVSNVSLTVNHGDYWLITGENGTGKSTLLKGVLGLLPLTSGSIDRQPGAIGYVPQLAGIEPGFPASVYEVALSGCVAPMGLRYRAPERKKARDALEQLGIAMLAERSFHELSGGQKQRVLLARALCAAQSLLALDEPDAGLDPVVAQGLYAAIRQLHSQGTTVLMISHSPEAVLSDATGVLHLGHGVRFRGTPAEYQLHASSRGFLGS